MQPDPPFPPPQGAPNELRYWRDTADYWENRAHECEGRAREAKRRRIVFNISVVCVAAAFLAGWILK
jgi:hypothetical protein